MILKDPKFNYTTERFKRESSINIDRHGWITRHKGRSNLSKYVWLSLIAIAVVVPCYLLMKG